MADTSNEPKKEILTEKLENFLRAVDDVRPEICDLHFQKFMMGFNIMINGMFGEADPTPEQEKIVNNWCERQLAAQQAKSREDRKKDHSQDTPRKPDPNQLFNDEYGDFFR